MENTNTTPQPVSNETPQPETPKVEAVSTTNDTNNFAEGGEFKKGGEYSIVTLVSFSLITTACLISIYYHRQALNKLLNDDTDALKTEINEVKTNLKKLMGNKYAIIS